MVNYSWGDVWDERQKNDDIKRFYGPNSSGGSYPVKPDSGGYSYRPAQDRHHGRNLAIIFSLLAAGGVLGYAFNLFGIQSYADSVLGTAASTAKDIPSSDGAVVNAAELKDTDEPSTSSSKTIKHIEYVIEPETRVLLDRGAFLSKGGDSATFEIQIPNKDVNFMTGTIIVEGSKSVHVEFTSPLGDLYCSSCEYDVSASHIKELNIPVDAGDSLVVIATNPIGVDLQTVNIKLSVTYPEQIEKITYENIPSEPTTNSDQSASSTPIANEHSSTEQTSSVSQASGTSTKGSTTADLLKLYREYALSLINSDRKAAGLSPVELSDNKAAQKHADDMLNTRQLSHWTSDGMKPYMAYTIYGGLGNVGQNAGFSGYTDSQIKSCQSGYYRCPAIDVEENIKSLEYSMMHDDATSNWGHRDNILDSHHTHVSIGIAADAYTFAIIQNFEDNYIEFDEPITTDNRHITLSGTLSEGSIYGISIYYDELPTSQTYQEHREDTSYGMGIDAAGVAPPPYYYDETINISPTKWSTNAKSFDIQFDLEPAIKVHHKGVYTILVWLENDDNQFPVTSYSVFVE